MSGESGIRRVVVTAAGTRGLVSLAEQGCAAIEGGVGELTIFCLSTRLERIAARYSLSEAWLPMLLPDDFVASRLPAIAEALLVCPRTTIVDYEVLIEWTPRSILRAVLGVKPDAVVVDRGLRTVRRVLRPHFASPVGKEGSAPRDVLLASSVAAPSRVGQHG